MNILLVSEYFPPEIGAGSNRAYELSKRWVESGSRVTVITGFPDYPDGIIPEHYRGHIYLTENIDGIKVIRTFTIPAPNRGFFRRVLSFISFMLSSVIQGSITCGKQDLLIATSPPFFVGIAGYLISKIKRIPFVFEVRDLWPESIIQLGQLKNKLIIKLLELVESYLYKNSSHIIPVANSSAEVLEQKGISREKITVIKNGFNFDSFNDTFIDSELKSKLGLENKIVVSYIGTIGLSHNLDSVIEVADKLSNHQNIKFLIIGDGAERENLIKLSETFGLINVSFIKKVVREQIYNYYWLSDILLVPLKGLTIFKKVIPSKIFEIMACKKPILLSVDGEARQLVESACAGIFVEPENSTDLSEKIILLSKDEELRKKLGENGRKFAEKYYHRNVLADQYLILLSKILSNNTIQ
jgi:glycosyltransferase involved in cell wall biosynthesis